MQKRDGTPKKKTQGPPDLNVVAFSIVQQATGQMPKEHEPKRKESPGMTLGRLGALKGGVSRAADLTPEQRKEIAKKAAQKRWE